MIVCEVINSLKGVAFGRCVFLFSFVLMLANTSFGDAVGRPPLSTYQGINIYRERVARALDHQFGRL